MDIIIIPFYRKITGRDWLSYLSWSGNRVQAPSWSQSQWLLVHNNATVGSKWEWDESPHDSGSQLGVFWPLRGYLTMSEDVLGRHYCRSATGISWVEAREVAKQCTELWQRIIQSQLSADIETLPLAILSAVTASPPKSWVQASLLRSCLPPPCSLHPVPSLQEFSDPIEAVNTLTHRLH